MGWVSLVAFLGGLATCSLQAMQQVVSMSQMYHFGFPTPAGKSPAATQNGQFGVAVAILCFGALMSLIPIKHVNRLALASFSWLILSVVLITIVIPNIAPVSGINPLSGQVEPLRRTRDFVFATDYNILSETSQINGMFSPEADLGSRTNANAYTVCNGLLMAQFLILVFDVPSACTRRAPFCFPMLTHAPAQATWRRRRSALPTPCRAPCSAPSSSAAAPTLRCLCRTCSASPT